MSTNKLGLWNMSYGQIGATLKILEDLGVKSGHLAEIRKDTKLAQEVASCIIEKQIKTHLVDEQLLSIFDSSRFFGPTDWQRFYGMEISDNDVAFPIKFEVLQEILDSDCPFISGKKVKETHVMFYLPKITIKEWANIYPYGTNPGFIASCPVSDRDNFGNKVSRYCWYLMFRGVLPGSVNKNWTEQQDILPDHYEVPLACEVTSMYFIFFKKNKFYLNGGNMHGRTIDVDLYGDHVRVGYCFFDDRYCIDFSYNRIKPTNGLVDERNSDIGLFAIKNFEH